METQTATGLGEKKFLGQIVPGNFGGNVAMVIQVFPINNSNIVK